MSGPTDAYAVWLASVPIDQLLCETIDVRAPATGGRWSLGNRLSAPSTFTVPGGELVEFSPAAFTVSLPEINAAVSVDMSVTISTPGLELFRFFDSIRGVDLNQVVTLRYGAFLLPGGENSPLLSNYPVYYCTGATLTNNNMTLQCSTLRLPNRQAGNPYDATDFPALAPDY